MTPERFRQVEEVFRASLEVEPNVRLEFVRQTCAADHELREHVLSLLEHDKAGGIEPDPAFQTAVRGAVESAMRDSGSGVTPTRVGSYRIIRELGAGGFGVVYLAEQDRPRRTVALKLLRTAFASGESARRFEYEARILARLRHPGIAQIYEAGVAEVRMSDASGADLTLSQPFLALEYVEGPNIIDFARGDDGAWPPLPVRDRLALFARACDALQHAHQHGVIHRDLKPDNILVACEGPEGGGDTGEPSSDSGSRLTGVRPKLLDFGVARVSEPDEDLTRAVTATGRMVGTLAYMSPEQVSGDRGEIDTRSDVYAMGVLLYQLMVDALPYDVRGVALHEASRIIREREPPTIRSLDRAIRDEVNAVIRSAMAKERSRRYASVGEFAADIRRILRGEPIAARRGSGWYVLRKTMWRHRVMLGVGASFLVLLAASSVIGWTLYGVAQRARVQNRALLRESYLSQARATLAAGAIGRRFETLGLLRKAADIRSGADVRSEAIAAICEADFEPVAARAWPREGAWRPAGDGTLAVAPTVGGVDVFDPVSGTIRSLRGGPGFSPSQTLVTRSNERVASMFNVGDGAEVVIWSAQDGSVRARIHGSVARAPMAWIGRDRAERLVLVNEPGVVSVFDPDSGERLAGVELAEPPTLLCVSPNGARLAGLSGDGLRLGVVGMEDGEPIASITSGVSLRSVCWSDDGEQVLAGGSDGRIYRWDARGWAPLGPLVGHRAAVVSLQSRDDVVLSSSWDGTVRIWDLERGEQKFAPINGVEAGGLNGRELALFGASEVRVLRFADDVPRTDVPLPGRLGSQASLDFSDDGLLLAVAGLGGAFVLDAQTWSVHQLLGELTRSVVFPRSGPNLVGVIDGSLVAWDRDSAGNWVQHGEPLWNGPALASASHHPDGAGVVIYDGQRVVRVDVVTGEITELATSLGSLERPVLDESGRWLFLGTWRGAPARVVDTRTGKDALRFDDSSVRGSMSPDASVLTVGRPGVLEAYRVGEWQSPTRIALPASNPPGIAGASAVSPDGRLLAYVVAPHTLCLADAASGETLASLPNPQRFGIPEILFSPDGRLLVALTLEDRLIVWHIDQIRHGLAQCAMDW
ncbi:MAG: protein kinase [Phycisphaeraceae bacterium]|nr:protein kinase [Phycisphaeraceae bacterium]